MKKFALLALVVFSGCIHGRYTLPIPPYEAQQVYPAVLAVAQSQGHEAWLRGPDLQVELKDGTHYWWYTQTDGTVALAIKLAGDVSDAEKDAKLAQAKATADALWQAALISRQQYAPSPNTVVVMPAAPAPNGVTVSVPGMTVNVNDGAAPAPIPRGECRTGSNGVQACGYDCQIGSNGQAYCAPTNDGRCAMNSNGTYTCGRNCRMRADGLHFCQ